MYNLQAERGSHQGYSHQQQQGGGASGSSRRNSTGMSVQTVAAYAGDLCLALPRSTATAGALVSSDSTRSQQGTVLNLNQVKMGQIVIGMAQQGRGVGVACVQSGHRLSTGDLFLATVLHKSSSGSSSSSSSSSKGGLEVFVWRNPQAYMAWRDRWLSAVEVNGTRIALYPPPLHVCLICLVSTLTAALCCLLGWGSPATL